MTKPFWYKVDAAKRMAETMMLSRAERGTYNDLYNALFINGGFLPDIDQRLANATGCTLDEWREVRPVMENMFAIDKRGWHHPDLIAEMETMTAKLDGLRSAGRKGGKARSLKSKGFSSSICLSELDLEQDLEPKLYLEQELEEASSEYEHSNAIRVPTLEENFAEMHDDGMVLFSKENHAKAIATIFAARGLPPPSNYHTMTPDEALERATESDRWRSRRNIRLVAKKHPEG